MWKSFWRVKIWNELLSFENIQIRPPIIFYRICFDKFHLKIFRKKYFENIQIMKKSCGMCMYVYFLRRKSGCNRSNFYVLQRVGTQLNTIQCNEWIMLFWPALFFFITHSNPIHSFSLKSIWFQPSVISPFFELMSIVPSVCALHSRGRLSFIDNVLLNLLLSCGFTFAFWWDQVP